MSNFIFEERSTPAAAPVDDDGLRYDTADTRPQAPAKSKNWSAEDLLQSLKKSDESWGVEGMEKAAEKISGGLASGKKASSFDPKALAAGVKVEMEHTKDPKVAREIASDHLTEDPRYYEKLARMEKSGDNGKADEAVRAFLKKNPKPEDSQIHALAGKLGIEPDDLEERIYAMLGKKLKKSGLEELEDHLEKAKKLPSEEADITPEKARKILHDGEVHGKPLTEQQRKFFGAIGGHLPAPGKKEIKKSVSAIGTLGEHLEKAGDGPYFGPKGGKYADPQHKTSWKERKEKKPSGEKPKASSPAEQVWEKRVVKKKEFDKLDELAETLIGQADQHKRSGMGRKISPEDTAFWKKYDAAIMARREAFSEINRLDAEHTRLSYLESKAEKSMTTSALDILTDFVESGDEPLSKGMLGYGCNMDWANRMGGTPFEVEALQCLKDMTAIQQERDEVYKKYGIPWRERERMDPVERAKRGKKQAEEEKKCSAKEDAVRKRQSDLEKKYLDWRIEQAKEAKKSEGDDGDEVLEKAGPYIGPKGGKWADAAHTVPWKEGVSRGGHDPQQKFPPAAIESAKRFRAGTARKEDMKRLDALAPMTSMEGLVARILGGVSPKAKEDGKWKPRFRGDTDPAKESASVKAGNAASAAARKKYGTGKFADQMADEARSRAEHLYREKLRKEKMKKSMSGIEALGEHLEKSDIPTGQPTKLPTGDEAGPGFPCCGGPLAGKGKPVGDGHAPNPDKDQDAQGNPKNVPACKTEDWSLEADARQVFGGIGGTMKSVGPIEQDRAIAEKRLQKGPVDVHPLRNSVVHGNAEERIAQLSKGGAHEDDPRNAIIARDVLCKSCQHNHSAMLTSCPSCGDGTIGSEVLHKSNPGVVLEEPRGAPLLQPHKPEEDLSF